VNLLEMLKRGMFSEIWSAFCSWIDLTLNEFMEIQEKLLFEQLEFYNTIKLKSTFIKGEIKSIKDFREMVPLTTYKDYEPYIGQQDESLVGFKPIFWERTSGRSVGGKPKWIPVSKYRYEASKRYSVTSLIFSSAKKKGDVLLEPDDGILYFVAPRPYYSGYTIPTILELIPTLKVYPPLEEAEKMDFYERLSKGMMLGLRYGIDYFYGLSSVIAAVGERMKNGETSIGFSPALLHISPLIRIIRAVVKAKKERRNVLPKDLWKLKGIVSGGTDTEIFMGKIKEYWGVYPLNGYAATEGSLIAIQLWNRKGMTFTPDLNFYEFIPEEELKKEEQMSSYRPKTVLLNELKPGEIYEIVLTNLQHGVFLRYRIGDLIKVISLSDDETGVSLPQIKFYSRKGDLIDISGLCRITENDLWNAIEKSGTKYREWTAIKEIRNGKPYLHIYIESQEDKKVMEKLIEESLKEINHEFADAARILGYNPIIVDPLLTGTFDEYMRRMAEKGSDLGHLKPPHINPPKETIELLLKIGET